LPVVKPITRRAVEGLRSCRESLLSIPKNELVGKEISEWVSRSNVLFEKSDTVTHKCLWLRVNKAIEGFENEEDIEACIDIRDNIVEFIDEHLLILDSTQNVRPVLDELILKIPNNKLSTLLKEFNSIKNEQPNLAAMGFRTILSLIIIERAKIIDPSSDLATRADIKPEREIGDAIKTKTLFTDYENRKLGRYLNGGDKDSFDFVVHKPDYLIEKDELEDAVDLLNRLLPTIID
jgi:hypothetical protein